MARHLTCIIAIFLLSMTSWAENTPFSIRLNYMLKQIGNPGVPVAERLAWADSVIVNEDKIADKAVVADASLKKAEIAYGAGQYRRSLEGYLKWMELFGSEADSKDLLGVYDHVAELYYYIGWYDLSINLSLEIIKRPKPSSLMYLDARAYQRLAHCYIRLRDVRLANKYTHLADSCLSVSHIEDSPTRSQTMFDMSILKAGISIINEDYDTTHEMLGEARKYARSVTDSIAILGDEAIMYEIIGDPEIAGRCYENIISLRDTSYQALVCTNNYIHFLTWRQEYEKAHEICRQSYGLLGVMQLDHSKSNLLELESTIYMNEGDYANAYSSLKRSKEIADSIFSPMNLSAIYGVSTLTDNHNLAVSLSKERDRGRWLIVGVVGLGVLLIGCGVWFMVRVRKFAKDKKKDGEMLERMRESMEREEGLVSELREDMSRKDREMESYRDSIGEVGKVIKKLRDAASNADASPIPVRDIMKILEPVRHRFLQSDVSMVEFENIHRRLSARLAERHPDVTKSEINMAAYIVMNITTKEIADMQNLSTRTIENTKYRLYKKLGIPASDIPVYLRSLI